MGLHEGDEETLATLYDIYVERLYDYCISMTQQPKAAADIVHDTFIDASRRAPRIRNREQLGSWLYAAVRRRCLQRTRGRGLYWDWSGETLTEVDPHSGLPQSELRSVLEGTLERLDVSEQETLLLALRHGVTGDDLAAIFGVPTGGRTPEWHRPGLWPSRRSPPRSSRASVSVPPSRYLGHTFWTAKSGSCPCPAIPRTGSPRMPWSAQTACSVAGCRCPRFSGCHRLLCCLPGCGIE
jgi:RNA polymerase sigma factor (sigma-70 family)